MKPALLDVNVLIALIDPAHQFHGRAHDWLARNRHRGWATCPLTQNGCLRIMSSPGYPFPGLTPARVRGILAELTRLEDHVFWPATVSLLNGSLFDLADTGAKHLKDLYLLGLAASFQGRLATFDQNIHWQRVIGGSQENLEILAQGGLPIRLASRAQAGIGL